MAVAITRTQLSPRGLRGEAAKRADDSNCLNEDPVPDRIRDFSKTAGQEAPDHVRGAPGTDGAPGEKSVGISRELVTVSVAAPEQERHRDQTPPRPMAVMRPGMRGPSPCPGQ